MRWLDWMWSGFRAQSDPSYTEQVAARATARASGMAADLERTAIGAAIIGLYSRVFAACSIQSESFFYTSMNSGFMGFVGHSLAARGESVWLIDVSTEPMLKPVATHIIKGDHAPSTWVYDAQLNGPANSIMRRGVPGDGLLHFKINADQKQPWKGRSPFQMADVSAHTVSAAEDSLAEEFGIPALRLLGMEALTQEQSDSMTESLQGASGVAATEIGKPEEYKIHNFKPEPDAQTIAWLGHEFGRVLSAAGVPPALIIPGSNAQAVREAYRQFILTTVLPILKLMKGELDAKLDAPVEFSAGPLQYTYMSERARAFKILVEGGIEKDEARQIAGIE